MTGSLLMLLNYLMSQSLKLPFRSRSLIRQLPPQFQILLLPLIQPQSC